MSLVGVAVAAVAAFAAPRRDPGSFRASARVARAVLVLAAVALAGAVVASFASPRAVPSRDALRTLLLLALLVPLGASRVLDAGRGRVLLGVFLVASGANAVLSLLQSTAVLQPFALESVAGRGATGGFVGNEGQLALMLSVAAVAALGVTVLSRSRVLQVTSGAGAVLLLAAVVVNRNLTAVLVLATGTGVLLALVLRRRILLPAVGLALVVAAGMAALPPLRGRATEIVRHARAGEWDEVTSNRLGPWAAALEMVRERPLVGWGPGTFGAEFVPHRLRAELRYRTRFLIPVITSSYAEAHCDYLQAVAEVGIPAGLAAIAAGGLLLIALVPAARRTEGDAGREAVLLLAVLGAGAVAAITWFPFLRPSSAVPLLLAIGRGWRRAA